MSNLYICDTIFHALKLFFSILFIIIFTSSAIAQTAPDTIYYNQDWKKTYSTNYSYYRTISHADRKLNVEDHYHNGQVQMKGSYLSIDPKEIEDGHFTYYTESGIKTRDEYFVSGLLEGDYTSYDTTGRVILKVHFKHDQWDGHRTAYYPSGVIYRDEIYEEGKFISGHCYDEQGKEIKFFPREGLAEFPGGDTAMEAFIQTHLLYPDVAVKLGIQGVVKVKFVVGTDGTVQDAGVIQSDNMALDDAAIDVVKKLPTFRPAMLEGKVVAMSFVLPVRFKLVEETKK